MKKGKLVSCLAIAAVFMFSAALLALAQQQAPDEITIKSALWPTPTKTAVKFRPQEACAGIQGCLQSVPSCL